MVKRLSLILILGIAFWELLSAQDGAGYSFPFDTRHPVEVIELPDELTEISGIAFTPSYDEIAAVQDEDGIVYFIGCSTGKVNRKIEFWKQGDYEDLTFASNGNLWVLKSNSNLYEISGWQEGEDFQVRKYDGPLSRDQDVEGLTWDAGSSAFLLACKGDPGREKNPYGQARAIYSFAPGLDSAVALPVAFISKSDLLQWAKPPLKDSGLAKFMKKLADSGNDSEDFHFGPAAIARDPVSGHWYIASARGNILGVFTSKWHLIHLEKLSGKLHTQPEGLAFDRQGNLYISNEGKKDRRACILRFERNP